jgi:hypothetical protein
MSGFGESRARLIEQFGRPMRIRRTVANAPAQFVNVKGFASRYAPGDIEGAIQQGDERVEILHREIAAAGWTTVRLGDWVLKDEKQHAVQGSTPLYEGSTCIGHTVWIRA